MNSIIHAVTLGEEFRFCPLCGYEDGFHTMLKRDKENNIVRWLFICPACHEIFDVDQKSINP
jgi:rRNA maturation endonuclease Nob1